MHCAQVKIFVVHVPEWTASKPADPIHTQGRMNRTPFPIDVDGRTHQEYALGHAPAATHIPIILRTAEGRVPNPDFLTQVKAAFQPTDRLAIACGSGGRAADAYAALTAAGFQSLQIIDGGFKAWTAAGLPVEQ